MDQGKGLTKIKKQQGLKSGRKEKKNLKAAGEFVRKAAWTGVAVSLKVLVSTAITSATIAGIGAAGFQFLQSPEAQRLVNKAGVVLGKALYKNFVQPNAAYAANEIDRAYFSGMEYLNQADMNMGDMNVSSDVVDMIVRNSMRR